MLLLAVGRDLVAVLVEPDFILAAAAVDGVLVAVVATDGVIALAALDSVLTGVASELVTVGKDGVVATAPVEQVSAPIVTEAVVTGTTVDLVIPVVIPGGPVVPVQHIIAIATVNGVVAPQTTDGVVITCRPLQYICPSGARAIDVDRAGDRGGPRRSPGHHRSHQEGSCQEESPRSRHCGHVRSSVSLAPS